MDRREFIKIGGAGLLTLFLSGCGIAAFTNKKDEAFATQRNTSNLENPLKIVVLTGSPHERGTSALLADKFIEGAQTKGHQVYRFDTAFAETHPCLGCNICRMNGPCVYKDDVQNKLMPNLLEADLVVFITPLYYYGMSTQIKTVLDRFHARAKSDKILNKKSMIMATAYNNADWTMEALLEHYNSIIRFMQWEDIGKVMAVGCGSRSLIEQTDFPNQAYKLGFNL